MPNDPDFQRRVVKAALDLLNNDDTPVLVEYPEEAPAAAKGDDDDGWVCPISLPAQVRDPKEETITEALSREIAELAPWYDLAVQKSGRTTVGSSGFDVPAAGEFIVSFLSDGIPDSPIEGERVDRVLKWACDDLKAYYYEAMLAQPGGPSSLDLDEWFFGQTTAGAVFFGVQKVLLDDDDEINQFVGKERLIPRNQQYWSPLD